MKVALYGGAFDPIHVGHLFVISSLLNSNVVDEVWIVPSGTRPDKRYVASTRSRLAMVTLAVEDEFELDQCVFVRDYHCSEKLSVGHSTYHLLDYCRSEFPTNQFYIAIGQELVSDLERWYEAESLKKTAQFLVVTRGGYLSDVAQDFQLLAVENPTDIQLTLSSSALRTLLQQKKSTAGLIPAIVQRYIAENSIYG